MITVENSTVSKLRSLKKCFFLEASPPFTRTVQLSYVITIVLDAIFAIFAVIGNGTVMISLKQTKSLHSPSNVLLCSLVASDFLTGLVLQPLATGFKLEEIQGNWKESCYIRLVFNRSMWMLSPVTFISLVGISVERYLALYLHLRYKTVVTMHRMVITVLGIWTVSATIIILEPLGLPRETFNYIISVLILLGVSVITTCSVKIFKIIQQHQSKIKSMTQNEAETSRGRVRMVKLRKSSATMCFIVGIFLVCYMPFVGCLVAQFAIGYTSQVQAAKSYCATLVFLNSSFNVPIYCARIGEIRKAMKRTWQHFCCLKRNFRRTHSNNGQSSFNTSRTVRKQETFSETMV